MIPTSEQTAIVTAFATGNDLVIEAGAGTGKTSTLRLLAASAPTKSFLYLAFNKAIATEAAASMPANVEARTAHSVAFRAVGRRYAKRLNGPRVASSATVRFLDLSADIEVGQIVLTRYTQARLVGEMVSRFCRSADDEIKIIHGPFVEGLSASDNRIVAGRLLPYARKAWADLIKPVGVLRFTHDHYLKLWQLSHPVLSFDVILFDEAQDANPVLDAVVAEQTCQKVYVGDRAQAIYGWAGAIDSMIKFAGTRLYLSQSFRFGPAIADVANGWLAQLDTPLRLTGHTIDSTVGDGRVANAVLTRTNAGAIEAALAEQGTGRRVHLVGGASDLRRFAEGARDLKERGWTSHPDLSVFKTWGQVQDYSETDPDGSDLAGLVRLIDRYSVETVLAVLDASVGESSADVVISTAHKAKGREWSSVRIASDFERKIKKGETEPAPLTREDIMLRYVAVTRAKEHLNPGPLPVLVPA